MIDALARTLQLNTDEWVHLFALAHPDPARRMMSSAPETAKPSAEQLLYAMGNVPTVLLERFNDILAWNHAVYTLLAGHLNWETPAYEETRPNQIRMLFLDEHIRELYVDWQKEAERAVASMRYVAAKFANDRSLAELVGELSMKSPKFTRLWAGHDVRLCTSGTKHLRYLVVGEMILNYEVLHMPEGNGQRILTHTADFNSASHAALCPLCSM